MHAEEIKSLLKEHGVERMPLGLDLVEPAMLFELQRAGLEIRDCQQVMLEARELKSIDEIMLLNTASAMVDGVYHMLWEKLKPGVRESDLVAEAARMLYQLGSDDVEAINAISGERCSPIRTISPIASYGPATRPSSTSSSPTPATGPATTAPSTWDAPPRPSVTLTRSARMDGPHDGTGQARSEQRRGRQGPAKGARSSASKASWRLSVCSSRMALGLALHERPLISRLNSLKQPAEIKAGMVFALETYCPASDGFSAARIEEELVVTPDGCKVITLFPAQELPIANPY